MKCAGIPGSGRSRIREGLNKENPKYLWRQQSGRCLRILRLNDRLKARRGSLLFKYPGLTNAVEVIYYIYDTILIKIIKTYQIQERRE